jgi:hypothetical protein
LGSRSPAGSSANAANVLLRSAAVKSPTNKIDFKERLVLIIYLPESASLSRSEFFTIGVDESSLPQVA